ncbi:MAG: hypothetical protein QXQ30_02125 [Candidatus Pacearchaeota archaeon]
MEINEKEYENLLDIFSQLKKAIKQEDIIKLKDLSNRTIHSASINQDTQSISIAVIVYSISKIIERKKYREYPEWPNFYENIIKILDDCYNYLEKKDFINFNNSLQRFSEEINKLRGHLRDYIEQVFRKAKINKASRIYEHGISFAQTAEIMGITLYELAEYVGTTGISNVFLTITKDIDERIKILDEIFE